MVSYAASMQGAKYDLFAKVGNDDKKITSSRSDQQKESKPKSEGKKGGFLSRIKDKMSSKGGSTGGSKGGGGAGGGAGNCCIFNEYGGGGCGPCNGGASMSRIMISELYGLT
jgi:hypothetical protein